MREQKHMRKALVGETRGSHDFMAVRGPLGGEESSLQAAGAYFSNVNYVEEPTMSNSYSLSVANTMK